MDVFHRHDYLFRGNMNKLQWEKDKADYGTTAHVLWEGLRITHDPVTGDAGMNDLYWYRCTSNEEVEMLFNNNINIRRLSGINEL